MSVDGNPKLTLLPDRKMDLELCSLKVEVLGKAKSPDQENWVISNLLKPFWRGDSTAMSKWINKLVKNHIISPLDFVYVKPQKGPGAVAVELHLFVKLIDEIPCVNIDRDEFNQEREKFTKIIEGNRDMIKPYGASAAPQTHVAAAGSTVGMSMGASAAAQTYRAAGGASDDKQSMLEPDLFAHLPLAPAGRCVPFICSSYCEENIFYTMGGCPTCNVYWANGQHRDSNVQTKTVNKIKVVDKTQNIPADILTNHYSNLKERNPTWKMEGAIPVPPLYHDAQSLDKKQKTKRKLEWQEEHDKMQQDDTKLYPRVPPTSYKVLCPTYQCSDFCMTGVFKKQGCPTCRVFWDAIGVRYPGRPTTRVASDGHELRNANNIPYETYEWNIPEWDEIDFKRHQHELRFRYPDWKLDESNCVLIPAELLTKNEDAALMLTKAPYDPGATLGTYNSRFSWIRHNVPLPIWRTVLAFWPKANGWFPALISGFCVVKKMYSVKFFDFDLYESESRWKRHAEIKLVVWAPSHSTGTKRDPSLVGKKVMAQDFGVGWMPGIIVQSPDPPKDESSMPDEIDDAESDEQPWILRNRIATIAKEQKKYYVVFDELDRKPGDPLSSNYTHHRGLHPYQFCVLLDETLPSPEGLIEGLTQVALLQPERDINTKDVLVMVWDDGIFCPEGADRAWRLGWTKQHGLCGERPHILVVIQGECEMLEIRPENCIPLSRPPNIPVYKIYDFERDPPFDLSLVWRKGFVLHADNDGLEGWTCCAVTGLSGIDYRVVITDTRESYSTVKGKFVTVQPSELWLHILKEDCELDKTDAADTTMNEVQTDATDAVQDLAGAAENIDLNQE